MPKIPVLESQLGAPRGAALDVSSPQTYMPFTAATMQTGNMVEQRGETMLREYDTSRAYTAFNQLRDVSRGKINELLAREGLSAQGAQTEYTEFYRKAQEDVAKETINAFSQRSLYDKLAQSHQQGDLDNLARHEFSEHKKYKVSVVNGYVATTSRDVADNAADYDKVDGMIYGKTEPDGSVTPGLWGAIDALGSGIDRTTAKMQATEAARYSQVDSLISSDPKKAMDALEKYKGELGDKYAPLKKRLQSQVQSDRLESSYAMVVEKFGSNYDAAWSYVNKPENRKAMGLDWAEGEKLSSKVNSLRAEREAMESNAITHMHRTQEKNLANITAELASTKDEVRRQEIFAALPSMVRRQEVSVAGYNALINPTAAEDDLSAIKELDEKLARHEDVSSLAIKFKEQKRIKGTTADNYVKAGAKAPIAEGEKNLMEYLNPGLMGAPDAYQLRADARENYFKRLRENPNADPLVVSKEIINSHKGNIKRTLIGSPTPTYMPPGAKNTDPIALSQALEALVQAFQSGQMGDIKDPYVINKYNEQYNYTYGLYLQAQKEVLFDEGVKKDSATSSSMDKSRKLMGD